MNKFTKEDEGKAAIFTDNNGTTYSCTITGVTDNFVILGWETSPTSSRFISVHKSAWHNIRLFPAGAMFATI